MQSFDRYTLITYIAGYMWQDTCQSLADDLRIKPDDITGYQTNGEDLSDNIWNEAAYILAITEIHNNMPIDEIARELGLPAINPDLDTLGYYIYMQCVGHGVAWSDDHDVELNTPHYEVMATYEEVIDCLPEDAKEWYRVKELTNQDAYDYAIANNRVLRLINSSGRNVIITYDHAKNILESNRTQGDYINRPLIMVSDWR